MNNMKSSPSEDTGYVRDVVEVPLEPHPDMCSVLRGGGQTSDKLLPSFAGHLQGPATDTPCIPIDI